MRFANPIYCHEDDINRAELLTLLDPSCVYNESDPLAAIQKVDGWYVITVGLDECGTVASLEGDGTIKFSNSMVSVIDTAAVINMDSRVQFDFSCKYNWLVDVSDVAYNETKAVMEQSNVGMGSFAFDLQFYTNAGFNESFTDARHKVGSTLFFQVENLAPIDNTVFQVCLHLHVSSTCSYM